MLIFSLADLELTDFVTARQMKLKKRFKITPLIAMKMPKNMLAVIFYFVNTGKPLMPYCSLEKRPE